MNSIQQYKQNNNDKLIKLLKELNNVSIWEYADGVEVIDTDKNTVMFFYACNTIDIKTINDIEGIETEELIKATNTGSAEII